MFPWDRLRTLRSAHAASQEDVGKRLGVSQAFVSQVELGQKEPGRSFCNELEILSREWGHKIKASEWDSDEVKRERARLAAMKLAGAAE